MKQNEEDKRNVKTSTNKEKKKKKQKTIKSTLSQNSV